MAAVESGDHDVAGDDGSAGTTQGQHGHGPVVHPAPFPGRSVESEELSVDSAYGNDSFADRGCRQYFARHPRAPRHGTVGARERDHLAAAAADNHEARPCAGPPGDGDAGIGLPEPLAAERVVCRDVTVVAGGEHLASGELRSKLEATAVLARGGPAAPEFLDLRLRLECFEVRRCQLVLVVSQEPGEAAAARQGEHRDERDGSREQHAALRMVDVVRIAHRGVVHVNWMEEMSPRRDRRASSEPGRGSKAKAPHRQAPSRRIRGPRHGRREPDGCRLEAP